MSLAAIVNALVEAGASPQMIAAAVAAAEANREKALATKRAKAADKKRLQRAVSRLVPTCPGDREGQTGTEGDSPLDKEGSPTPPKEIKPLSPPSEVRDARAREGRSEILREFSDEFWPAYPHKVGKPLAEKAFIASRQKAGLPQILAGLGSYIRNKPPDRSWCNPATWLNQERWNDVPADHQIKQFTSARSSKSETFAAGFLGLVQERAPGRDGRSEDIRGPYADRGAAADAFDAGRTIETSYRALR